MEAVFSLFKQKENFSEVMTSIENSIPFKGTNLWVLIFAIFIASLGLNVNSTAVIIGAMLISPLMGPIIGIGFSVGINHPEMLKLSLKNYFFSFLIGLATSTLYFLISPLSEAHSEILARTSPNIYDVFIAFFGGAAGMLANGSKMKGNIIPGVAIATALMPPLCTAGYGIATGQFAYFFGAIYLYLINTVYIAVSTFLMVKILSFPAYHFLQNEKTEHKWQNIMWALVLVTLLPSIYFGYVMIKKNSFEHAANRFINNEAIFPNNFLLQKNISYETNTIELTYGGQKMEENAFNSLKDRLKIYDLDSTNIKINQGFNFVSPNTNTEATTAFTNNSTNISKESFAKMIAYQDSINSVQDLSSQVFKELRTQNNNIKGFTIGYVMMNTDSTNVAKKKKLILVETAENLSEKQKADLERYLKVRVENDSAKVIITNN